MGLTWNEYSFRINQAFALGSVLGSVKYNWGTLCMPYILCSFPLLVVYLCIG